MKKINMCLVKTTYGSFSVYDSSDGKFEGYLKSQGYVQASDFIEVEFEEYNKDKMIKIEVESIDKQIKEESGKHYAAIKRLEQKKQELLAITHEVE